MTLAGTAVRPAAVKTISSDRPAPSAGWPGSAVSTSESPAERAGRVRDLVMAIAGQHDAQPPAGHRRPAVVDDHQLPVTVRPG